MSFSHLEPHDVAILRHVQEAMASFYTVLCRLPHLDPSCVRLPPRGGWPNLNAGALKGLGKSDKAIEFVRHLPCVVGNMPREPHRSNVMITPLSDAVAFNEGDVWEHFDGFTLETPPHVIAIARPVQKEQNYLFLNTEDGTVFEHGTTINLEDCEQDEYKRIPSSEKWRALTSLPATAFFNHERKRLECLVYMPFQTLNGEPEYYFRATSLEEEQEIFEVQDEWEASQEYDPKYKWSGKYSPTKLWDSESDSEMSDVSISVHGAGCDVDRDGDGNAPITRLSEVHLRREVIDRPHGHATGDETSAEREISSDELEDLIADMKNEIHVPAPFTGVLSAWKPKKALGRKVKCLYHIYKRNGWPYTMFDVQQCRIDLDEFATDKENGEYAFADSSSDDYSTNESSSSEEDEYSE